MKPQTPQRLEPERAIADLPALEAGLRRMLTALSLEADTMTEQWEQLGRIGGQRADHAAALMSRLRPILRDLAVYCNVVEGQIDKMVADPFGRTA